MPAGLTNNVSNALAWDWRNSHVTESYSDAHSGLANGTQAVSPSDFIDSSTVLLCAGPATLLGSYDALQLPGGSASTSGAPGIVMVPVGLAMGISLQINRQSNKIFEVGSRLGYTISGRVAGGMSISRALINGGNLLKVLYAGEVAADCNDLEQDGATGYYLKSVRFATGNTREKKGYTVPIIGSGNIALNLDSAFFNHPFGLALIIKDQTDQTVSQHYFEGCVITSYNVNISADMNVLTEGVSIEWTKITPIITTMTMPIDMDHIHDYLDNGNLTDNSITFNSITP